MSQKQKEGWSCSGVGGRQGSSFNKGVIHKYDSPQTRLGIKPSVRKRQALTMLLRLALNPMSFQSWPPLAWPNRVQPGEKQEAEWMQEASASLQDSSRHGGEREDGRAREG